MENVFSVAHGSLIMEDEVTMSIDKLSRRIEDLSKDVTRMNQDRELLENIETRLKALELAVALHSSRLTEMAKNTKEDIGEVRDAVSGEVGKVAEQISDKTIIIPRKISTGDKIKKMLHI